MLKISVVCRIRMSSFVYNPDPFADPYVEQQKNVDEFNVRIEGFRFRVKVGDDMIAVGSAPKPECVEISPSAKKLVWLGKNKPDVECELDGKKINSDATIKMMRLALTLLRQKYPDITQLTFEDASKIDCDQPDGTTETMNLAIRDALLYGQTFYERHLGAVPEFPEDAERMHRFRRNRYDPLFKPELFDFNNSTLKHILNPYWKDSSTWAEFFYKLHKQFGSRTFCAAIYPWYVKAFTHIQGIPRNTFPPFNWMLNVWSQPDVPYERVNIQEGGGDWVWPTYPAHPSIHQARCVAQGDYGKLLKTPIVAKRRTRRVRKSVRKCWNR